MNSIDLPAPYEWAVGGTLLPALLGFFQGTAVVKARRLTAQSMVPHVVKWLETISQELPNLAHEIDNRSYDKPSVSVGVFYQGIERDEDVGGGWTS